jgi:hypothetical protein
MVMALECSADIAKGKEASRVVAWFLCDVVLRMSALDHSWY